MFKTEKCSCGTELVAYQMPNHRRGAWHRNAKKARALRKMGLTYAEVARQVGMTKQWVFLALQRERL